MADPLDASKWPSYPIEPRESVFALGVVSVNYAGLEFALGSVFTNVLDLASNITWALLQKIGNEARIALLEQALCERDWPAELKECVIHFIKGFKILAENRNQLIHSNIFAGVEEQITLYKSNRAGKTILIQISPADLRQVADNMMVYRDYGLAVANAIVLLGNPGLSLDPNKVTTLDTYNAAGYAKPPLPVKLKYTSLDPHYPNWTARKS
jgi:hypothetical protein